MKRMTALLLLLLISVSCVIAEEHPVCWVQYANLLPRWGSSYTSIRVQGCVQYCWYSNVDSEMVENYLKTLEQQGFNCAGSEGDYALFCKGCIILIHEYMADTYEIALWRNSGFRGQTNGDDLTGVIHEKELLCSLDISPETLLQGTGLQLFVCVSDPKTDELSALNREFYLVGNGTYLQLDFLNLVCADLDQDGTAELLTVEWGPASGLFSLVFKVYDVQGGTPYLQTGRSESLANGRFALIEENGKAYFEYARQYYDKKTGMTGYQRPRYFEISLNGNEIVFHSDEEEDVLFNSFHGD